jgi:hypothetical protein
MGKSWNVCLPVLSQKVGLMSTAESPGRAKSGRDKNLLEGIDSFQPKVPKFQELIQAVGNKYGWS